jgi:hypothetical protein
LMGIMYQANETSSYYPESKDSVTAVVIAVVVIAIVYYVTVLVTEIVVFYNEEHRTKQLAAAARTRSKSVDGDSNKRNSVGGSGSKGRLVTDDGSLNLGKVDTQMNPLFMNKSGDGASAAATGAGMDSVMAMRSPPPQELWSVFQQGYADLNAQLEAANAQLAESKKREQLASAMGNDEGVGGGSASPNSGAAMAMALGGRKKAFDPRSVSASAGADNVSPFRRSASGKAAALKAVRTAPGQTAAAAGGDE